MCYREQLREDDVADVNLAVVDAGGLHQHADVVPAPHPRQRHIGLTMSEDVVLQGHLSRWPQREASR